MTLIERIDSLLAVWRIAVPHIPAPAPESAMHWLNYPNAIVEAAIMRTARKFSREKLSADFTPTAAYRYVTSTARVMNQRAKERLNKQSDALSVALDAELCRQNPDDPFRSKAREYVDGSLSLAGDDLIAFVNGL
jgi:hypothetical protein